MGDISKVRGQHILARKKSTAKTMRYSAPTSRKEGQMFDSRSSTQCKATSNIREAIECHTNKQTKNPAKFGTPSPVISSNSGQSYARGSVTHCKKDQIYVFPEMKLCGLVPNFHIDVSLSD
jgi:hypothetical protein